MLKQKIIKMLGKKLGTDKFVLLTPKNSSFGDYAIHINQLKDKKVKIQNFIKQLKKEEIFEKIEEKSGFINFFISKKVLVEELKKIVEQKGNYGKQSQLKYRLLLEFGQPNTHKIPHLGHLFSYIYGESLARIFEANGWVVYRTNYQGDIGLHVAKCLWKMIEDKKRGVYPKNFKTLLEKVNYLQKCYQEGATYYQKDNNKKIIDELNKKLYEKDPEIYPLWQETRQWSLDFYRDFEKKLGITYDHYYFESETAELGEEVVLKNLGRIFEKSQGAVIFNGKKYGLHTRVFINQYGNPTYEAKDIGLLSQKIKDFNFDLSLVATANEQNEYWKVIIKVSELLYPKLTGKLKHIGFGMVNLSTGKMSSRTGQIVDPFTLLEVIKNSILNSFDIKNNQLAEKIALAAIKYSLLNSDYRKDIVFDLSKSIAKEGSSGPYLLYTYVRCQSVLGKAKFSPNPLNFSMNRFTEEEINLLRSLFRFPEIVSEAAKNFSPHLITNYLFDLAQKYNLFYQKHRILEAEEDIKNFRLLLTQATGQVIKNGLFLLGIETVEKM